MMKVKEQLWRPVVVIMLTVLIIPWLAGCGSIASSLTTARLVVDKDVSADRSATVTFPDSGKMGWFSSIREWNGNDIADAVKNSTKGSWDPGKVILTVPAGDTSFTFDVQFSNSEFMGADTIYTLPNIVLNYKLEAGKKYQISTRQRSMGWGKGFEFFVMIYDISGKEETLLKEWKLGQSK